MTVMLDPLQLPLKDRVLIEASAGTGKTYSLTALYVRLVLGQGETFKPHGLDPQHILVLTYTRAATEELRARIRLRLEATAKAFEARQRGEPTPTGDAFIDHLVEMLEDPATLDCFVQRAQRAARNMDQAAIYTIHSFCQRALKRFAFAAAQPFEQALEPDANLLVKRVYQDYWRRFMQSLSMTLAHAMEGENIGHPDALKKAVDDFKATHDWQQQAVDQSLPDSVFACEKMFKKAEDSLQKALLACRDKYQQLIDWFRSEANDKRLQQGIYGINAKGKDNLKPFHEFVESGKISSRLMYFSLSGLKCYKGKSVTPPDNLLACLTAMDEYIAAQERATFPTDDLLQHAANWTEQALERQLSEQAQVTYDSMVTSLAKALDREQSASAEILAAQLYHQYPCTLIDEFQDTDAHQYAIFRAIYAHQSPDYFAWLMIGDPKQAIYSFRGANLATYLEAKQDTSVQRTLNTNYRASANMIRDANQWFNLSPLLHEEKGLFGDASIPFTAADTPQDKHTTSASALTLYYLPVDGKPLNKETAQRRLARQSAYRIHALCRQEGAYRAQDITVLVRSGTEAKRMRAALTEMGMESVYLSDKSSVFETPEAQDLLLLLRTVAAPHDGQLLRSALATSTIAYAFSELDRFSAASLEKAESESDWQQMLHLFRQFNHSWRQHGVLAMIYRLVHELHLAERHAETDNERAFTNLFHLTELLQQAAMDHPSLDAQINWLETAIADKREGSDDKADLLIRLENERRRVQVMTLHKSKGLQFPVVFLPFVSLADMQHDINVDEDMRLLYVGITRAEERCFIGLTETRTSSKDKVERSVLKRLLFGNTATSIDLDKYRQAGLAVDTSLLDPPLDTGMNPQDDSELADLEDLPQASYVQTPWRLTSYSGLTRFIKSGQVRLPAEVDDTAENRSEAGETTATLVDPEHPDSIHTIPGGRDFGLLLHAMLESACNKGFAACDKASIKQLVANHCRYLDAWQDPAKQALLSAWIDQLITTALPLGDSRVALANSEHTLAESEFFMSFDGVDLDVLQQKAGELIGLTASQPHLHTDNGMIRGYIDLLFNAGGKYYVLDYKTNRLGDGPAAYSKDAMTRAMREHRYDVQALIYQQALHRLLQKRLGKVYTEHPERYLGGCAFFFLRGIDHRETRGLRFIPANFSVIETTEKLLSQDKVKLS